MQEAKLFKDSQRIQKAYEGAGYAVPKAKYTMSIDEKTGRARINFEVTDARPPLRSRESNQQRTHAR